MTTRTQTRRTALRTTALFVIAAAVLIAVPVPRAHATSDLVKVLGGVAAGLIIADALSGSRGGDYYDSGGYYGDRYDGYDRVRVEVRPRYVAPLPPRYYAERCDVCRTWRSACDRCSHRVRWVEPARPRYDRDASWARREPGRADRDDRRDSYRDDRRDTRRDVRPPVRDRDRAPGPSW